MKSKLKHSTCNMQPVTINIKPLIFSLLLILLPTTAAVPQQNSGISNTGEKEEKEQAVSLLGKPLFKPELSEEAKIKLNADYEKALADFRARPGDPDAHIWLGRRLAYLGDYIKAIRVFSDGMYYFPNDARFYRHRGHRFITIRQFEMALEDLEQAAKMIDGQPDQVEPDGAPNQAGIPVSSLHSNIWYHLGLAQYLLGDFEAAFNSFERCYKESDNNDKLVSSAYWLYIISCRLGKDDYAHKILSGIDKDIELIENFAYHELLMFYKSGKTPEKHKLPVEEIMMDPTRAYGLGIWYLLQDDAGSRERGMEIFNKILDLPSWPSFGYIAAEAELAGIK
jgi:tetratricopeptide (TPR) repeat protein